MSAGEIVHAARQTAAPAGAQAGRLTLPQLAHHANAFHADVCKAGGVMLERAIAAGVMLSAAKAQVGHGEWTVWLAGNFDGSDRTARLYMQLAAHRQDLAGLQEPSLTRALAAISAGEADTAGAARRDDSAIKGRRALRALKSWADSAGTLERIGLAGDGAGRRLAEVYTSAFGDDAARVARDLARASADAAKLIEQDRGRRATP